MYYSCSAMDVEIGNEAGGVPVATNEERVATVTAVDPSALTPSAMRGLRDIGSQVNYKKTKKNRKRKKIISFTSDRFS